MKMFTTLHAPHMSLYGGPPQKNATPKIADDKPANTPAKRNNVIDEMTTKDQYTYKFMFSN
jgi:hypothetical protein